jgi:hypothetical protein
VYDLGMENGEPSMKIVGRKGKAKVDVNTIDALQRLANELRSGRPFMPKGVWRFKTFEEADAWKLKMLTRRSSPASQP